MIARGAASSPGAGMPGWLLHAASVLICLHFLAVGVLTLSASSGPWSTNYGPSPALAPQFAISLSEGTGQYLQPLGMIHTYHFDSSRVQVPTIYVEALIYDDKGELKETLRLPDPKANPWVRERQKALVTALGDDQTFQPAQGEAIPAPGQKSIPQVNFFFPATPKSMVFELYQEDENRVPRERPTLFRPSEWSLILVKSYARYLQKERKAARVELVRHSKQPLSPALMMPHPGFPGKLIVDQPPPDTFEELVCNFGDGNPKRWRPGQEQTEK